MNIPAPLRARALVAAGALIAGTGTAFAAAPPVTFSDIARTVTPAVVNIASEKKVDNRQGALPFEFPRGTPFEEFFRRFRENNQDGPTVRAQSQGSGFIVDAAGYIVTNDHVVDGATDISVTLDDGRKFSAKVVGIDDQTDLAVLKIDAGQRLAAVEFGDSDKAEVGDWVLAVGNPFGLGGTVTAGIISARGRNLNAGPYDDFLQVDAPINLGNSGGPLFSLDGHVIGINSAIVTPNRGSVGIGFAIPASVAQPIVAQLIAHGSVVRGWLGVQIQPVTPELAEAIGLDKPTGAMVAQLVEGGPAATAGLRDRDVILSIDGKPVADTRELLRTVAAIPAGRSIKVEVWRDRARLVQTVAVTARPAENQAALPGPDTSEELRGNGAPSRLLGATVGQVTSDLRDRYDLPDEARGVVVMEIGRNGAAQRAGLRPGDVIQKVGDQTISSPAQLEAELRALPAGQRRPVLLQIVRQGTPLFLALRVG